MVCYWFAKALREIDHHGLGAAGLVATNSIRGGANRKVLETIVAKSRIFEARSDEPWINEGAAVRVSLVCFGHGDGARLNGIDVPQIYADLTAPTTAGDSVNLSMARPLATNMNASFQGASKKAKFEIDAKLARQWLRLNPPEWTERVPETVPLGMTESPYPDRIVPKHGYEKQMATRTLTNLYNQRPTWLDAAHKALDQAVACAYGWTDYWPATSDETILSRLLALNLARGRGAMPAATTPLAMAA